MRYPMFSALSLATLLLACAHDAKNQRANNDTTPAERAEARAENGEARAERRAEREEAQREHADERVDVPRHRGDRDRVASADGVPERRERAGNENDSDDANADVSAFDQGNNEVDLDLTQRIRKAVMDDDSLSFKAKNVKIITRDGRVNLTGTVNTAAEKEAIYKCAVSAAGVGHVNNQLEVDSD